MTENNRKFQLNFYDFHNLEQKEIKIVTRTLQHYITVQVGYDSTLANGVNFGLRIGTSTLHQYKDVTKVLLQMEPILDKSKVEFEPLRGKISAKKLELE